MNRILDGPRDEHGRLVLGNPRGTCEYCGAAYTATVAENNKAVWWHVPPDCCMKRRIITDKQRREKAHE